MVQGNRSQRISKGVLVFCRGFCPGPLIQIIASRPFRFGRVCCCTTNPASSLVVAAGLPSRRVRIRDAPAAKCSRRALRPSARDAKHRLLRGSQRKGAGANTGGPRGPRGALKQHTRQRGGWMEWCRLPGAGAGCNLQTVQTSIRVLTLELLCAHASHMAYYAGRTHLKSTSYVLQNFALHHIGIFHLDV